MTQLKILLLALVGFTTITLSSCVTKRTVRDSSGNVIYKDTMIKRPLQSKEKTMQQVFDKEVELGVY